MRIDLPQPNDWIELNEKYRAAIGLENEPGVFVQAYAGFQHALWEATNNIARLFQHKKNIAFATGLEPGFEPLAAEFSEREYILKDLSKDDLKNPASLTDVLADLLFVVAPEDDPVTGRKYDLSGIETALKDKRVFKITVSHSVFRGGKIARPFPFEIKILSLSPEYALIVAGERSRMQPLISPRISWADAQLADFSQIPADSQARVEAFEAVLPGGFKPYFAKGEPRSFDRAVIYHPALDGSAVVDELNRLTQSPPVRQGLTASFESTSSCRWPSPRLTEFLLAKEGKEELVRGLVIIDVNRIDASLRLLLEQTSQTLLKQQNG